MAKQKFLSYEQSMRGPTPITAVKWTKQEYMAELERIRQSPKINPRAGVIATLFNESTGDLMGTTPSMLAGFQWIEPGEKGEGHRHTFASIYYIVEGRGYTVADGSRIDWEQGDVLSLPAWADHENVNLDPDRPAILLGIFDLPLVTGLRVLLHKSVEGGHQKVIGNYED